LKLLKIDFLFDKNKSVGSFNLFKKIKFKTVDSFFKGYETIFLEISMKRGFPIRGWKLESKKNIKNSFFFEN